MNAREVWLAGGHVLVIRPTWPEIVDAFLDWCTDSRSYRPEDMVARSEKGGVAVFRSCKSERDFVMRTIGLCLDALDGDGYLSGEARLQLECRLRGPLVGSWERAA